MKNVEGSSKKEHFYQLFTSHITSVKVNEIIPDIKFAIQQKVNPINQQLISLFSFDMHLKIQARMKKLIRSETEETL